MRTRGIVGRHLPPLLILATVAVLAAPPGPAQAGATARSRAVTLCGERAWEAVVAPHDRWYLVKNDNYGGRAECITNVGRRPNFTVTRSAANSYSSAVMAYPFVLYGCSWGQCPPGSPLPRPIREVRRATATWTTVERAGGRWNAAFDIWFGRHRSAYRGQARGAELMVWLNARHDPAVPGQVVRVDHRRWYVYHWVAAHDGAHWNYIQVRAVHPVRQVHRLALLPIIRRMERLGLIHRRWWLLNIESGFEIWHGGVGLATTSFSAHVSRR